MPSSSLSRPLYSLRSFRPRPILISLRFSSRPHVGALAVSSRKRLDRSVEPISPSTRPGPPQTLQLLSILSRWRGCRYNLGIVSRARRCNTEREFLSYIRTTTHTHTDTNDFSRNSIFGIRPWADWLAGFPGGANSEREQII